ncbi:Vacuolar amino acid transporter 4 [Choanephora cucurbitarum]|uniref:Vacuolar amino acid transporter 4 n=1 Tax=Choanephora cucurbitarum TaxID=101091 RepID=A0A1C7NTK9_9FUNG|nr:Vacuolar amino acid transporter 4 [Choanephora cucurbitarum]
MDNRSPIPDNAIPDLVQHHLVDGTEDDCLQVDDEAGSNEAKITVPYHLPGASVTHDIYTHAKSLVMAASPSARRTKSMIDLKNASSPTTSSHSSINEFENLDKPGGFRRFHVHQQQKLAQKNQEINEESAFQELFRPESICSSSRASYRAIGLSPETDCMDTKPTRHFLEYLAIASYMNQFAGEDLSDTDESQTGDEEDEESTALLSNRHKKKESSHKKANVVKTIFLLFKAFIDCKEHLTGSYGDMGGQLYGHWMRRIVLFSIAISQMGFVCGGTIFIVENITEAVRALSGNMVVLSNGAVFVILAILLTPLVLIRNIAKLSPTALLSDALIVAGLLALLVFDCIQLFKHGEPRTGPDIHWVFNSQQYAVFIGTAVYSFEGIGLIIPIRDSMEKPEKFPIVLTFVMVLVAFTLCTVGLLGYVAFGKDVQTVALLNLPSGVISNSVQIGYAVAVLLSNALALFPTIRIVEHIVFGERTGKHNLSIKWQKNGLRTAIVIVATLIAWGGASDLDKFISLIGSVCCCPLSLIFPPLFHMALPTTKGTKRTVDLVLIFFGFAVMLFTFYSTSKQWVVSG